MGAGKGLDLLSLEVLIWASGRCRRLETELGTNTPPLPRKESWGSGPLYEEGLSFKPFNSGTGR